ncbi:hypothetical protein H10PHJ05_69 [Aeromonas phage HJ05]|nr:hypothetical protein H10PHJ05_69 [Aeromonas phage HJ05]
MRHQVITVSPDGQLSGLLHKKDKGLDLLAIGGHAEVKRISLVQWAPEYQRWWVELLLAGSEHGTPLTHTMLSEVSDFDMQAVGTADDGVALFQSYEEGVAAEVAYLDMLRLTGRTAQLAVV